MGLFSGLKAAKTVQEIKKGGTGKLSLSDITNLLVNLPEAQSNLSKQEYDQVFQLFSKFKKCKTKIEMNQQLYLDNAIKIIRKFNNIAPYEKYSGGNEIEFSFMLEDLKDSEDKLEIKTSEANLDVSDIVTTNENELKQGIIEKSFGRVTEEECSELFRIIKINDKYGNDIAKEELNNYIKTLFKIYHSAMNVTKYSFIFGFMQGQSILTEEEMHDYVNEIIKNLKP